MAPVYSTLLLCSLSALSVFAQDASFTDDAKFEEAILSTVNRFRSEHGAPDLTWNDTLATKAAGWAKQCRWRYSDTPSGETLATGHDSVSASVEWWANERNRYNFDDPGFSFDTNHFTQLVWKESDSIGCARYDCGPLRPGDDDWDDLRWDNPDYDRNDQYEQEDDRYDDRHDDNDWDDRHDRDDMRDDDRHDDHDDRYDDDRDDRDDRDDDRDDRDDHDDRYDDDRKMRLRARRNVKREDHDDHDDHDNDDDEDYARGWYVVCNYSPPGNILGGTEFKDNVLPKGSSGGGDGGNGGNGGNSDDGNNGGDDSSSGGNNGGSGGSSGSDSSGQSNGSDDSSSPPDSDNAGATTGVGALGMLVAVGVAVGMM